MRALIPVTFVPLLILITGCGTSANPDIAPKPRPVTVQTLTRQGPPVGAMVSASVASWKEEDIGFEVSGRVEWVAEPGTEIEGRVLDSDRTVIVEGNPIARVESEKYRLQVDAANADVARAGHSIEAARIELESGLPAKIRAARAEENLALVQLNRSKSLLERQSGSQADVDRDAASHESAVSAVEQLQATVQAKEAELASLQSQLLQAKQALRDAERTLEDCTLYSSFRGQVADISVVPGSVVGAGEPVARIQMMNPIKVELEVSAADSRRLQTRERLPVLIPQSDGTIRSQDGFLYHIDSVADINTRTYTVTLLLMNDKSDIDDGAANTLPTTNQTWRLDLKFLPGTEDGKLFIPDEAIQTDADGDYLWKIENAFVQQTLPADRRLKVSRLPITRGPGHIPFLGNWIFQEVLIDDEAFDPSVNLVAGRLLLPAGGSESWTGDTILISTDSQWKLRSGDLVRVNTSDSSLADGYYVPMNAIIHDDSGSWIYVVDDGSPAAVRRLQITTTEEKATSPLRRISAADGSELEGLAYVTSGSHYLHDGEQVHVMTETEAAR